MSRQVKLYQEFDALLAVPAVKLWVIEESPLIDELDPSTAQGATGEVLRAIFGLNLGPVHLGGGAWPFRVAAGYLQVLVASRARQWQRPGLRRTALSRCPASRISAESRMVSRGI